MPSEHNRKSQGVERHDSLISVLRPSGIELLNNPYCSGAPFSNSIQDSWVLCKSVAILESFGAEGVYSLL